MRARLHVRGRLLGFFREGTHDLCDAAPPRQLLPATSDTLDRLMAALRSSGGGDVREIELSENVDGSERVAHLETAKPLDPRLLETLLSVDGLTPGPYVTDTMAMGGAELKLRRHVLAFFQGNRFLLRDSSRTSSARPGWRGRAGSLRRRRVVFGGGGDDRAAPVTAPSRAIRMRPQISAANALAAAA